MFHRNRLDFCLHVIFTKICICADIMLNKLFCNFFCIIIEIRRNWNNGNLFKSKPGWHCAGKVFNKNSKESFKRSKNCAVKHNWMMLLVILSNISCIKAFCTWKLEVSLDSTTLPFAA